MDKPDGAGSSKLAVQFRIKTTEALITKKNVMLQALIVRFAFRMITTPAHENYSCIFGMNLL